MFDRFKFLKRTQKAIRKISTELNGTIFTLWKIPSGKFLRKKFLATKYLRGDFLLCAIQLVAFFVSYFSYDLSVDIVKLIFTIANIVACRASPKICFEKLVNVALIIWGFIDKKDDD
ncbi:MAG: hypothetical protein IKP64_13180 [Selenomonadaceae bacterium]|nr:hypothetical protein [Selenomonadaceae bacterium]